MELHNMKACILMLRLEICDILEVETESIFKDLSEIIDSDIPIMFNALKILYDSLKNPFFSPSDNFFSFLIGKWF